MTTVLASPLHAVQWLAIVGYGGTFVACTVWMIRYQQQGWQGRAFVWILLPVTAYALSLAIAAALVRPRPGQEGLFTCTLAVTAAHALLGLTSSATIALRPSVVPLFDLDSWALELAFWSVLLGFVPSCLLLLCARRVVPLIAVTMAGTVWIAIALLGP